MSKPASLSALISASGGNRTVSAESGAVVSLPLQGLEG